MHLHIIRVYTLCIVTQLFWRMIAKLSQNATISVKRVKYSCDNNLFYIFLGWLWNVLKTQRFQRNESKLLVTTIFFPLFVGWLWNFLKTWRFQWNESKLLVTTIFFTLFCRMIVKRSQNATISVKRWPCPECRKLLNDLWIFEIRLALVFMNSSELTGNAIIQF